MDVMSAMLREAHSWCFDGPDCMLTWPCRVVISRFQAPQSKSFGKIRPFDPYKEPGTLKTYFGVALRALAYFDRVAATHEHCFSVETEDSIRPEDSMRPTEKQRQAWSEVYLLAKSVISHEDEADEERLKSRLLVFWMLLGGHQTGSRRYHSPLLSFCAMLSIKPSTKSWLEPGNFNSQLSAMIWVVQLLFFYDNARKEKLGEGNTLTQVKQYCERFLQQTVETPMGEVLRWRLLLFRVSNDTVGDHEAFWDEAEQVLTYEDVELHMDRIPTLLESEYRECRRLLYNDLMCGGLAWRDNALAAYEVTVQEFLKRLSVLIRVSGGTPLADMTSHALKRKRSISEYRMSDERTLMRPRFTEENRDDQAEVVYLKELSSATKTSFASGKDASEHRQRSPGADRPPVAVPSEANHDGDDSNLLGQVRSSAQSLADELEKEGQDIWTGAHPLIMLSAGFCKPRDLRLLATDGRLTDEFLNTVPVLGDCKDTDGYLLPTFVVRLIKEASFKDLDRWTKGVPKQSKPWVFGLHESNHWMAVRIDWTGRLIQHYDPMHQKLTRRSRRLLQLCMLVAAQMLPPLKDFQPQWMTKRSISCTLARTQLIIFDPLNQITYRPAVKTLNIRLGKG
ncbi:hypothetical protein B0A55_10843 [Friedmanniomyces simplex]|uniref:Uncharacterized protein n=1 Tax=Friedmanniomyces simplex TaxID=329884 RepID=A0A4U0XBL6_9PEZI|nr:hypothetical protein B0A55_10843 [Friedmanniomyces simplex]